MQEALEIAVAILARPASRLVEQKHSAGPDGGADRAHQSELVAGRQVMDRQAAPRRVGVLRPPHHGV
jgi:hypothetical protein